MGRIVFFFPACLQVLRIELEVFVKDYDLVRGIETGAGLVKKAFGLRYGKFNHALKEHKKPSGVPEVEVRPHVRPMFNPEEQRVIKETILPSLHETGLLHF